MQEVHAVATYEQSLRVLAQRLRDVREADDAHLAAPPGTPEKERALRAYLAAAASYGAVADAVCQLYGVEYFAAISGAEEMLAAQEAGDGDA